MSQPVNPGALAAGAGGLLDGFAQARSILEALPCKGEDAGVADCEAAKAHDTCARARDDYRCPRTRLRRERAEARRREIKERESRRRTLLADGIPELVLHALDAGEVNSTQPLEATRAFLAGRDRDLLLLLGTVGTGKTFAACIAACEGRGWPRLITAKQLERIDTYDDATMRDLEERDILIIDDAGEEYADRKGHFVSLFGGLINARYSGKKRTIITSNFSWAQFRERYGVRVEDRIAEAGKVLSFTGASLRRRAR